MLLRFVSVVNFRHLLIYLLKKITMKKEAERNQPLYKGERSWETNLETLVRLRTFIGLGKYQLFPFVDGDDFISPIPECDVTATDLDFLIIILLRSSSAAALLSLSPWLWSPSRSYLLLLLLALNIDQKDGVLLLLPAKPFLSLESSGLDRRNGIARDLDRRNAGSLSIRLETRPTEPIPVLPPAAEVEKREKKEDEEEEEEVVIHEQGRAWAQSGQREASLSRRQTGQIPVRRRLEGWLGHFQTSSSST